MAFHWTQRSHELHQTYKIGHLVSDAKSTFYSCKVSTSSTVKELQGLINNLSGIITSTPLPSVYPTDQLPQVFSDFFFFWSVRFDKSVIPLTGRLFIPLHTVLVSGVSPVHPHCTPVRGFETVTQEIVLKCMKQMFLRTCSRPDSNVLTV